MLFTNSDRKNHPSFEIPHSKSNKIAETLKSREERMGGIAALVMGVVACILGLGAVISATVSLPVMVPGLLAGGAFMVSFFAVAAFLAPLLKLTETAGNDSNSNFLRLSADNLVTVVLYEDKSRVNK